MAGFLRPDRRERHGRLDAARGARRAATMRVALRLHRELNAPGPPIGDKTCSRPRHCIIGR